MNTSNGAFVTLGGERWYRIEHAESLAPFFVSLSGDSNLWAFISTNGSLAAGRHDQEQSFFPYETVDKIHTRWEHTGPRTWIRFFNHGEMILWEPFVRRPGHAAGTRNLYKNVSGTKFMVEDLHASGHLAIRQTWSAAENLGLVRRVDLWSRDGEHEVEVLDGLLNLMPAGVSNATYNSMSVLVDAYKWNESHAGGRLGVYSMYAKLWDRAEPKESLEALVAWRTGLQSGRTLLSPRQIEAFCSGDDIQAEDLARGQRGAWLVNASVNVTSTPTTWYQVVDGPLSQAKVADLAAKLEGGFGTQVEIEQALTANTLGLDELLNTADAFQESGSEMAAVHHTANVLFNIMRGGVFPSGDRWDKADLRDFVVARNRNMAADIDGLLAELPERPTREAVLLAAQSVNLQLERLVREYLPLTFSRRHGDPSRPWNRFSIKVRDAQGKRILNHQGNWRDIFQNWEALLWSEPSYIGSMISTFLSAMTLEGYNPYRIGRDGIDWETIEEDDSWSFIGYWGDHQVVYLLKFLEAAQAMEPGLLADLWQRRVFAFADVPYRIRSYAEIVRNPKATIDFDQHHHDVVMTRARALGGDGKLVPGPDGQPVMASLAEKLITVVLAKSGNLIPGGGVWLNTQRPEWNDANNALVGNGLSIVTLASLRRLLVFLQSLPFLDQALILPIATSQALQALDTLAQRTPVEACTDGVLRRRWMDKAGGLLERWRTALYTGDAHSTLVAVSEGSFRSLVTHLLPLVDATLKQSLRSDGLYHSYNLLTLTSNRAEIGYLYPMLEGQVALISSGLLGPAEVTRLGQAMYTSRLFDPRRRSFLLYPDRRLPGFLEKNLLDEHTKVLPEVAALIREGRADLFETQANGEVRFASTLSNRYDVETALHDQPTVGQSLGDAYERLLGHKSFTGRSGTMFGYEGLGCIYWHMVAKLLLAVQEVAFAASDANSPYLDELIQLYRDVRSGLGYYKTPAEYGAFPYDPYSHTPGEGGAQQPGMTGQVKEEILTRWGELGLRWKSGQLWFDPVLLDREEIPTGGELRFTYQRVPFLIRRADTAFLSIQDARGKHASKGNIDLQGAVSVEVGIR